MNISELPFIFSTLNAVSFVSLLTAYYFIKTGKQNEHRLMMITALAASACFLALYLIYHYFNESPVKFQKQGLIRYVYFTILISHTILAVAILPFIVKTVYHAIKVQKEQHKKIAKIVLPVWIYISFTGIVIYVMLYKL